MTSTHSPSCIEYKNPSVLLQLKMGKTNLVKVGGTLKYHKESPPKVNFNRTQSFFGNKLFINKKNCSLLIAANIRELFLENKLNTLLQEKIEETTGGVLKELNVKIENVNFSSTLKFNSRTIISELIPALEGPEPALYETGDISVYQEDYDVAVSREKLATSKEYRALKILFPCGVYVKFQLSKDKESVHITAIRGKHTKEIHELFARIKLLEEKNGCDGN